MSAKSKDEYFRVLAERYRNETSKKRRGEIISEACTNTGLHRKSVIRGLSRVVAQGGLVLRPGRPRRYSDNCVFALKRLYRESEYQCSGKLHAMIPVLIKQLQMPLPDEVLSEVTRISPASIDRYLKKYRNLRDTKKRTLTRPGSRLFRRIIPLKNLTNIAHSPGVLEGDTVGHCGGSARGEFATSLTLTDELTGWTKNRATENKCAVHMKPAIEFVIERIES